MNNKKPIYNIVGSHELDLFDSSITLFQLETGFLYIELSKICDVFNLNPKTQETNICRHKILAKGLAYGTFGHGEDMLMIGLGHLAMWLAFIDLQDLNSQKDIKEITLFQEESARILEEAFCEGKMSDWPLISQCLHLNAPIVQTYKETIAVLSLVKEKLLGEAKDGYLRPMLEQKLNS